MFVRFVCSSGEGIFQKASALLDEALCAAERAELEDLRTWFASNLPAPDRFVRTISKGYYRRDTVAICWFRDTAAECIRHAWRLVHVLERNGVTVDFLRSESPGYVTYEDDLQVAAIPFADR